MDRPTAQIRMISEIAAAFAKVGDIELYDEPIKQKDGSVAIGIWVQDISSKMLDNPEASRIEIVVARWGEV